VLRIILLDCYKTSSITTRRGMVSVSALRFYSCPFVQKLIEKQKDVQLRDTLKNCTAVM
jgi:hypothetical protein